MLPLLMLLAGVWSGPQDAIDQTAATTLSRLRSMDMSIRTTIEEGCRRSPLFAELVDSVERSNYFVYVEQVPTLRDGARGVLLHGGGGPQYLRVLLKRGIPLNRRVVVLAHELQHVLEVVTAGVASNPPEMDALFRRIGDMRRHSGQAQQYETAAALHVSVAVAADMRTTPRAGRGMGWCGATRDLRTPD